MTEGNKPKQKKPQSQKPPCDRVRKVALEALIQIEKGSQADNAIMSAVNGQDLSGLDMRFLQQLVNGATKMRRRLDHEIKFYLARPSQPLEARLHNILRLGMYQILFTDRVPHAAAVSESVNLARHCLDQSRARLVNAVLRARLREPQKVQFVSPQTDPVKHLGDTLSYPDYFVKYCVDEFGVTNAKKLLEAYNLPPTATYRVNHLKAKPEQVMTLLSQHDIEFKRGKYLPEYIHLTGTGLPLREELIESGKVFVQSETAGLPVRLMNPKPGHNVVDLTSAPGGKSTHAAIRMRNKGRVTAVDKSHKRLELVVQNAERLGIKIISPVVCDMMDFTGEPFDRVLLDPPCSGWGTAGKRCDLRWSKSSQDIDNLVKIQTAMIDRASRLVRPGGVLVYSTCTIIRRENDQIVEEFLLRNNQFELESAERLVDPELVSERGFVKTYPAIEGLDGAFCARLVRKLN